MQPAGPVSKRRVITALCLAPAAVAAIYLLDAPWFAAAFGLAGMLGMREWAGLAGWRSARASWAWAGAFALLAWLTYDRLELRVAALWLGLALWGGAIAAILGLRPTALGWLGDRWPLALAGILILWSAWSGLLAIRGLPGGGHWVLWVFVLVWSADIGAYLAGKRFGRRPLAPSVSPGKTWEGVLGGMALSCSLAAGGLALAGLLHWLWLLAILALAVLSIFGDLLESWLKRACGVKDSGGLLPGHGGVLDRIDSVLAVLPPAALIVERL